MTNQNFIAKGGQQWRNISRHTKFYSKSDSTPLCFVSLPTLSLFPSLTQFSLFPSLTRFPHQKNFNRRARGIDVAVRLTVHLPLDCLPPLPPTWPFAFHLTVCLPPDRSPSTSHRRSRLSPDRSPSTWPFASHLSPLISPLASLPISLSIGSRATRRHRR